MAKKSKLPKVNKTKHIRDLMLEQGAYDGRFITKTVELNKRKKPKHKNSIFNQDEDE
jgi:hypothetical protein